MLYSITLALTLSLSLNATAQEIYHFMQHKRSGLIYSEFITSSADLTSPAFTKYKKTRQQAPRPMYTESSIIETAIGINGKGEFAKAYTINDLGFRKTSSTLNHSKVFIVAGDSNVFGTGSGDKETLSYHLGQMNPEAQIVNLGMKASSPSSLLYLLQHYELKELIPTKTNNGIMLFDFSEYLIERVIGSKEFIKWGQKLPSYEINSKNQLVYAGAFSELWTTQFYNLINNLDKKSSLIGNLPRIHSHHIKLVARILFEIKKIYLAQSSAENRFAVLINPFYIDDEKKIILDELVQELHLLNVETIEFPSEKNLDHYLYPRDGHLMPNGQKYYAELINEKIFPKAIYQQLEK